MRVFNMYKFLNILSFINITIQENTTNKEKPSRKDHNDIVVTLRYDVPVFRNIVVLFLFKHLIVIIASDVFA